MWLAFQVSVTAAAAAGILRGWKTRDRFLRNESGIAFFLITCTYF
jgi:hypothetical protein